MPLTDNTSSVASICSYGINNEWEYITFAIVMVFILFASVVGNSIVVLATYSSRQLRFRVNVYFIASLAMSDMLLAVVMIPVKVSETLHRRGRPYFCHSLGACYWYIAGDIFCTVATILNLFFIAVDRFVAIRFPFKHSFAFTAGRVKGMIVGIWMFSAMWAAASTIKWETQPSSSSSLSSSSGGFSILVENEWCSNANHLFYIVSFLGIYIVPLCIMTLMYFMILKIALTQIRAIESTVIHAEPRAGTPANTDANSNMDPEIKAKKKKEKRMRKKELRATKSVAIVYFAFLVCWLPSCIITILLMTFDESLFVKIRIQSERAFYFVYYGLLQIFPAVHTMINPIIYSFSNRQFRKVCHAMYRKVIRIQRRNTLHLNQSRCNETVITNVSRLSLRSENTVVVDSFHP